MADSPAAEVAGVLGVVPVEAADLVRGLPVAAVPASSER
jgi:hypothetical protein